MAIVKDNPPVKQVIGPVFEAVSGTDVSNQIIAGAPKLLLSHKGSIQVLMDAGAVLDLAFEYRIDAGAWQATDWTGRISSPAAIDDRQPLHINQPAFPNPIAPGTVIETRLLAKATGNVTICDSLIVPEAACATSWEQGMSFNWIDAEELPAVSGMFVVGGYSTFLIKDDGTMWASGGNQLGDLGVGDQVQRDLFTQVGTDTDWAFVSPGGVYSTLAIKTDGTLWGSGNNTEGQLGLGATPLVTSFTQIGAASDWATVSAGLQHAFAQKTDGSMWASGENASGELGLGDTIKRTSFTSVAISDVEKISAGYSFTLARKTNGTMWSTGTNTYGELGLGDLVNRSSFAQVGTDTDWDEISAGQSAALATKTNGEMYGQGSNFNGQLGMDVIVSVDIPTKIGTDTDWAKVSHENGSHSMAIKTSGHLWATGNNDEGQLGLGGVGTPGFFQVVGTDANWLSVSDGQTHTVAMQTDGTIHVTGSTAEGQLGIAGGDRDVFTEVVL